MNTPRFSLVVTIVGLFVFLPCEFQKLQAMTAEEKIEAHASRCLDMIAMISGQREDPFPGAIDPDESKANREKVDPIFLSPSLFPTNVLSLAEKIEFLQALIDSIKTEHLGLGVTFELLQTHIVEFRTTYLAAVRGPPDSALLSKLDELDKVIRLRRYQDLRFHALRLLRSKDRWEKFFSVGFVAQAVDYPWTSEIAAGIALASIELLDPHVPSDMEFALGGAKVQTIRAKSSGYNGYGEEQRRSLQNAAEILEADFALAVLRSRLNHLKIGFAADHSGSCPVLANIEMEAAATGVASISAVARSAISAEFKQIRDLIAGISTDGMLGLDEARAVFMTLDDKFTTSIEIGLTVGSLSDAPPRVPPLNKRKKVHMVADPIIQRTLFGEEPGDINLIQMAKIIASAYLAAEKISESIFNDESPNRFSVQYQRNLAALKEARDAIRNLP